MATSVVIPCFTHDEFLKEAIDSVVMQTRRPLEVIVIDDGSPEPLRQISNEHNGVPVRWLRTENRGLGAARNHGAMHAKGDFVAFLDSDDFWEPTKLEKQEEFLMLNPEHVGCYTRCKDSPGFFKFGPYPESDLDRFQLGNWLWSSLFFPPSCVLIRTESFRKVGGFMEGLSNGEDIHLWMRLLELGPIGRVDRELCWYRIHNNQISGNQIRRVFGGKLARKDIIENHASFLQECGIPKDQFWKTYRNDVLTVYFKRDFKNARRLLADYLSDHPTDFKLYLYLLISFLIPPGFFRR
jgi:glycosyltransferase involved in cell wall biosynthesis